MLRFFDQVRFYPVSESELDSLRTQFREGTATVRIESEVFDFAAHRAFLAEHADDIAAFQARQKTAFDTEVLRWKAEDTEVAVPEPEVEALIELRDGEQIVQADMRGNVWKIPVVLGQRVAVGDPLVVVEAMKMELAVSAPYAGIVRSIHCVPGKPVNAGDALIVLSAS